MFIKHNHNYNHNEIRGNNSRLTALHSMLKKQTNCALYVTGAYRSV